MVPVVSDHTWYFPCLLHLERGWIAFLQLLNKVVEGAGALHGVVSAANFCLELGKEGEGGAEFSAACSADVEAGDPRGPQYLKNSWDHPAFPLHDQKRHSSPSQHTGMFPLCGFSS